MLKIHHQRKLNKLAKILIAFSITLLVYGAFLDYYNQTRLYNPVTDVTKMNNDPSKTTVDINSSKVPSSKDDSTKSEIATTKESNSNNETYQNQVEETPSSSLSEVNNNFRIQIQNTYGVTIKYGSETDNYEAGGLTVYSLYDEERINTTLNSLNNALSLYPSGLFREINDAGIPLTIYLIGSFSTNGVTGLTDSSSYYANIVISTSHPFEESFYHESYHYLERYMFDKKHLVFTNWNSYNPPGFNYGEINNSLSYASNGGREDSYFVNNYAQTSDAEDRASTFEYMMDYYKAGCLNQNTPVWKKAKLMSDAIDAAVDSCSPNTTEHWERFL